MFRELNSLFRKILLIIGAGVFLLEIAEKVLVKKPEKQEVEYEPDLKEDFQTQEFDDIW